MTLLLIVVLTGLTLQTARPAGPDPLAIQVALDRAGFSPGVIDGRHGPATRRALDAFRLEHNRDPEAIGDGLLDYTISAEDVSGPFVRGIPADLMEQAELPALGYTSPVEALAERFHTTPDLLRRLNPQAAFTAGERIRVPDVEPFIVPAPRLGAPPKESQRADGAGRAGRSPAAQEPPAPEKPDVVVTVARASATLTVTDLDGGVIFHAPVTTGSRRDPLPVGKWKVTGVQYSPAFHYNPALFWDADPSHAKAIIPPGPNNPVGVVWIDLSKEHYGLHGTPEPAAIGRSESHGCVRLTNWDALKLAGMVKPGTQVVFKP